MLEYPKNFMILSQGIGVVMLRQVMARVTHWQ
jgi:hypothetical protein